jgi:hypothetical protein
MIARRGKRGTDRETMLLVGLIVIALIVLCVLGYMLNSM